VLGHGQARGAVHGDRPVVGRSVPGPRPPPIRHPRRRDPTTRRAGRRRDDEQGVGVVLGADGAHEGLVDAEQLLDRLLGAGVVALAVVVLEEPQLLVEQVPGRPARDVVLAPGLQVGVEGDGMLDAQARDGRAGRCGVAGGREAWRVHADDAQPAVGVPGVPGRDVRQGAQRVDAQEVPELDQDGPADLLVHPQRRHVDPLELRQRRGVDAVDGRAHERREGSSGPRGSNECPGVRSLTRS
jgi:hypothetical protein